jgi:hypothetical protein
MPGWCGSSGGHWPAGASGLRARRGACAGGERGFALEAQYLPHTWRKRFSAGGLIGIRDAQNLQASAIRDFAPANLEATADADDEGRVISPQYTQEDVRIYTHYFSDYHALHV